MPHSIPRGLLRILIVRLLHHHEMTGTDIMRHFRERSEGEWSPSPGSIYPLLASLEEEGFIETVKTEGRSKTYRLSDEGRSQIEIFQKRRNDVEHKARLNRMIWIQMLEPYDRANFHASGIFHAIDDLGEAAAELSSSDRRKLSKRVKKAADKLDILYQTLKQGD